MDNHSIEHQIGDILRQHALKLAIAESCTGGLICHQITNVPGSSDYFVGGVIAYSNEIKTGLLKVGTHTLYNHGAVSEQTIIEMATGVRHLLNADIGISVSGVAGPGGGTEDKPVGTVWIGMSSMDRTSAWKHFWHGDRQQIKSLSAQGALQHLFDYLQEIFT